LSALNLHHHRHRHRLRPRHTVVCWSGPRPLPLTGQRTDRWSSQTPTPIQGVVREGRVLSTVGIAPIRLHRSMTLRHRAVKERREEKEKTMIDTSWWSPAPLGRRAIRRTTCISIGPWGRPQGPQTPQTTTTLPTSPTHSLIALGPLLTLPSSEVGHLGSETPSDLKCLCGNRLLCQFTHHTAPSGKG
jgi:hypothetical protein